MPWTAFEGSTVFLIDAKGYVTRLNGAASRLLRRGGAGLAGRHCWEITGFCAMDGSPFCGESCPVQRLARAGRLPSRHRLLRRSPGRANQQLDLVSYELPTQRSESAKANGSRRPILHLVLPPRTDARYKAVEDQGTLRRRLGRLTPRETEVLRLLARGLGTTEIASRLYISRTTVRNHVQHILCKLRVHRRLEAILKLNGES